MKVIVIVPVEIELFTLSEMARQLQVTKRTIKNRMKAGKIKPANVDGRLLFLGETAVIANPLERRMKWQVSVI